MRQNLGLEAELADSLAILARSFRSSRGGELDVVSTKLVESLSDFDLLLEVEVRIGKSTSRLVSCMMGSIRMNILLALSQSALNDLES
jgi:Holliday junction resolvase-like predicted endonuclease